MMKKLVAILLLLAAPAAYAQARADEPDVALVRELLSLSGTEKQYNQVMTIMMESVREGFGQGFADSMREKPLDAARQQQAQAIAERYMQDVLREYSEEIRRVMPYERLVVEVYAPLYRKYFTRAELVDAIAFFKSASGRKFAETAPQLMQDSSRAVTQQFMPQLNRRMGDLVRERMQKMAEEIGKL